MQKYTIRFSSMLISLFAFFATCYADVLRCPEINQLASGKFINVYQSDKDAYMIYGFLDVNNDIYQRWGLTIYDVKSSSIPGALDAANLALKQQRFSKITENADCSGGNRGGVCQCTYQINVEIDGSNRQYNMYADAMN